MRPARQDALWALIGVVYCLAVWWPTRELPYHWDGAMFVARGARDLLERGFWPLVVRVGHFAHPPLFVASLSLCWRLFGDGRLVGHLLVLPSLPLLLASTYAIGRRLYGPAVAAAAAALSALPAVVVAEYGQLYFDLPQAALLTAGIALWLSARRGAAGVMFAVAAGMKVPSVVIPCALLAAALLRRERLRALWPLLLPVAVLAVWLVYHHAEEGFWLVRPGRRSYTAHGPAELAANTWLVLWQFLGQQRWVIAAAGGAAGLVLLGRKLAARQRPVLDAGSFTLVVVLAAGLGFFALTGEYAQRYGIMLMPPLFLLCAAAVHALIGRQVLAYVAVVGVCGVMLVRAWVPSDAPTQRPTLAPDADLAYLDMIGLGRQLGAFMEREHPRARVFGSVPESYWLTEPFQGYVRSGFEVTQCREFRTGAPGEKVIVAHLYSREFKDCWRLAEKTRARPVVRLQQGGKWLQVFVVE